MGHSSAHRNRKPAKSHQSEHKNLKRKREAEDLSALSQAVESLETKPENALESFEDLPISRLTKAGLSASHFKTLTAVQTQGIPIALKGLDILGAAKTGSGKTLAFLVPVLENLYRKQWTEYDGLGALILSPTRELAIQIFEVLRRIGRNHTFSAGLVIGGKSLQEERERLGRMNILVATPGRMLQHMDQTADFDIRNLQMLVLDEADRIMDLGFQGTVDAIVEHLPQTRQTLLFSATQTKKVGDLARLSLTSPEHVLVHEAADMATPSTLQQHYVVTPLPEKLDTLWSFLRSSLKSKTLVFLSSGKQVRFVYEAFRHLQPGVPLMHIHGRQRQTARLDITTRFSRIQHAVLFATDLAARGLDFPAVDWVIQVDCPEDAETYIHRVGRTARFNREGRAVLFLDPTEEEGTLRALSRKKVLLEKVNVRARKQTSIKSQLQNMCFKDPELKYLGQKAFITYVKSVYIQHDKETFDVKKLSLDEFAASMGLPGAPRVKFVKGDDAKTRKNVARQLLAESDAEKVDELDRKTGEANGVRTKYDRMFDRRNQDIFTDHYKKLIEEDDSQSSPHTRRTPSKEYSGDVEEEDNDFMAIRRRFVAGDINLGVSDESSNVTREERSLSGQQGASVTKPDARLVGKGRTTKIQEKGQGGEVKTIHLSKSTADSPLHIDSNRRAKLLKSKRALLKFKGKGSHVFFDDNDVPYEPAFYEREEEFVKRGKPEDQREKFVEEEQGRVRNADVLDKAIDKQKKKEKKEKRKQRERQEVDEAERQAILEPMVEKVGVDLDTLEAGEASDRYNDDKVSETQTKKRRNRKWFQDASSASEDANSDQNKQKHYQYRQHEDAYEQPETLEDLETMARGLLTV